MKRGAAILSAAFFLALISSASHGAVSVNLRLDRSEATLSDTVAMIISVSGARENMDAPLVHGTENFDVSRGGTSSRLEIVNGVVNARMEFTYLLRPRETGTFEVGPAEIRVQGQTFRSNTAALKVGQPARVPQSGKGALFAVADLSPGEVYVEQQAVCTLKLFSRIPVSNPSPRIPENENMTFKQIGEPLQYGSVLEGRSYQVVELHYALVPLKEGRYTIGPLRIDLTLHETRKGGPFGLFDDPFFKDPFFSFSTPRPVTLMAGPVELNVLSYPEKGRPVDFTGLAGQFTVESSLQPATVKTGESATLTVVLTGQGNVQRMPDLKLPRIEQVRIYADQPLVEVHQESGGMTGSKTMKWALVPEKEGVYQVPQVRVVFFDTGAQEYLELTTPVHVLSVVKGEQVAQETAREPGIQTRPGVSGKEIEELGQDILPIHASVKGLSRGLGVKPKGMLLWAVLLLPALVYSGALVTLRFRKRSDGFLSAVRAKKAARAFLQQSRPADLSAEQMSGLVREYLRDRLHLSPGSMTPDEAAEVLRSCGARSETAEKFRAALQRLDDAVYSGKGQAPCPAREYMHTLVRQLEKEIR
jgi:hypothetical protein